jgi:hypothetical protein
MRGGDGYEHPGIIPDQSGGTGVSPAGWLRNHIRGWFSGSVAQRNVAQPAPFGERDEYPSHHPPVKQPAPFGAAKFRLTRRFDRGAYAYAYQGGALTYDPIGPGVVATRPLPVTQPAAIKLPYGAGIFWAPGGIINFGIQPVTGPIYTPAQLAALTGNPALAGGLPNINFIPAPSLDTGFEG